MSLLFGGAFGIGLWWWTMQAHDRVDSISREVCKDLKVQRLDEAIALRRVGLARTADGMRLERVFSFEFSVNGADRRRGEICLHGNFPCWVHLDHPDGDIHIDLAARD
jgi:Protein of unknown function (DUF3301)